MKIYNYRKSLSKSNPEKIDRKSGPGIISRILPKKLADLWQKIPITKKTLVVWAFRVTAISILGIAFLFIYFSRSLPDPNRLLGRNVPESTKIYDRNGGLLYEVHGEFKRTLINLEEIPKYAQEATIAVEDKNFYNHAGISITGLARSIIIDLIYREKRQGGSTITQQFVKNAVLTREKSLWRKLKEIILSIEIEARFSKADILKLYLNEIPYGRNAYGIQAASETYFNKPAKELTLAESAYLAAMPQAPTYYNPAGPNRKALDNRQQYILGLMKEQGYIDNDSYDKAIAEKVEFKPIKNSITAPYFSLYVQSILAEKYGEKTLEQGGLKVYTTLDPKLQEIAEQAVKEGVAKNGIPRNAHNAALVAIDPKTGQILAFVGGKDYFGEVEPTGCKPGLNCTFEPNVNVAVSAQQPGSSFKPYAYLTAFSPKFKYAPASVLIDVVTNFGSSGGKDYIPKNYNLQSHGPVSIRKALAGSLNVPAVKILALVGVENVTQTARDLGITSKFEDCGLSLVLGGCEVKLVDHVAAYSTIANGGLKNDKTAILKVVGQENKVLEEYKPNAQQVVDPQAAYELISIMTDNGARSYVFGNNSPLTLGDRPFACKTGTTQQWRDGWTMCFTPSLVAGVWSGNNDNREMKAGSDGVFVAAPIVNKFFREALKGKTAEEFTVPKGITKVTVDTISGKLPTQYSAETKNEVFADYAVPKDYDDVHIMVRIDKTTGKEINDLTISENIEEKIFAVLHSEKRDTPSWESPVIAWARANGYQYPSDGYNENSDKVFVEIVKPLDGNTIPEGNFSVEIKAASDQGISKIELNIDGESIGSVNAEPYLFNITKKLSNGQHTLTAKAIDNQGRSNTTTALVNIGPVSNNITLVNPVANQNIVLPIDITALSDTPYSQLTFYYQAPGSSSSKMIGQSNPIDNGNNQYVYSVTWEAAGIKTGTYQIYAKASTGNQTPKTTVTISTQ